MNRPVFECVPPAWRVIACVLVAVWIATACGGGVDSGGTGAPANTYSSGRISGFGSVIVNGVHFDDSNAIVVDDDGATHARSELKLGMVVNIDAGAVTADASTATSTSVASEVQFGSVIKGPVESVNVAGNTLVVLGQTVQVDIDTVFEGVSGGLAGVRAGDLLELHGFLDAGSGVYAATRIETESSLSTFKLKGVVASLDTTAKTFFIGAAKISYAGVIPSDMPNLANGAIVSVKLQTAQQGGVWLVSKASSGSKPIPDDTKAELEGFITDFVSLASFKVNGTPVDAGGSGVVFKKGTSGQLANGARVEVEGTMHAGVLVAQEVEFKKSDSNDHQEFDLHGVIESVNAGQSSFVLHGTTITYDDNTNFDHGTASNLVVGAEVDVKGVLTNGGTEILATKIKFGK